MSMPIDPWLLVPMLLSCAPARPVCVVAGSTELKRGAPTCRYVAALECNAEACAVRPRR